MGKKDSRDRIKLLRALAVVLTLLLTLLIGTPALAAPVITPSPSSGAVGTRVTLTGTNFDSYRGDEVFLFFDNQEIPGSPVTIPEPGTFNLDFNVPDGAGAGSHTIRVRNDAGSTLATSTFSVPDTEIRLDRLEGMTGTTVKITGKGFYAQRLVSIYYYGRTNEKLGTEVAGATGEFTASLTVPESIAGKHRIMAQNAEGNSAFVDFEVVPFISLNLATGAPGDILTVSGSGFGFRQNIGIFLGKIEVAYARSSDQGSFTAIFSIPEIKSGDYDVKAIDQDTNVDVARITITAGASLNQNEGSVGTEIVVRGIGFKPLETVIIKYGSAQIATATTDSDGAFTSTFTIPSSSGQQAITVTDGTVTRALSFDVERVAPISPIITLPLNASQAVAKTSFDWLDVTDPSMPVTYRLQVAADPAFTSLVLEKEGFEDSQYDVKESEKLTAVRQNAVYYWRVMAQDSAGNKSPWSETKSFYVIAPSVPTLLLPGAESKADAITFFDWTETVSPSAPFTYHLQIAADARFSSALLEKETLSASEYTLTGEEKLSSVNKKAPYYWRIKASDIDGNQSDWSAPQSFYVGFSFALPSWALYTLIGIAVVFIGLLAFWFGRRTAYYREEV